METLVRVLAPRGWVSFIVKFALLALAIGTMNYARDILEHGADADTFWRNAVEAFVVAFPFIILALAMVGYLNKLQAQLYTLAHTDVLTDLPNRRAFLEALEAAIAKSTKDTYLLMIDADHFKRVNDAYGHASGDTALRAVASLLRDIAGPNETAGRLGGEEFGLILQHRSPEALQALGARLAAGVITYADDEEITLTLSIGAAVVSKHKSCSDHLRRADAALYQAKSAGRARMVRFEEARADGLTPASDAGPVAQVFATH